MRIAVAVGFAGLLLAGSNAFAQDVAYDYDKATDFTKVKTYAWVRGTGLADDLNHKRIVAAVDAQLTNKGLTRSPAGATPDVLVTYQLRFDTSIEVNGFGTGSGRFGLGGFRSGTAQVNEVLAGSLEVNMVDAKAGSVIWRAVATKSVDANATPEKREKNIAKAAERLFKSYPGKR